MKKFLEFLFISFLLIFFETNAHAQIDNLFPGLKYRNVGPTRGGRVTTVAGTAAIPGTFYMGATGGGVWKTTDYGISWKNISDGYFASPSIGDIQVAKSDSSIIYVGTGSDGIRSNIIAGKGMYKSEDEGKTWKHIGLEKTGQIGAVEVNPNNPDIVFVAAIGQSFNPNMERGVYRTMNGGESWEQVLFDSDSIGAVDIEFHPEDPSIIYATMWRVERKPWTIISGGYKAGGVYRSTDGGDTWTKLENGLPDGLIGKIDLAVSAADPDRLYALVEAPEDTKQGGLYRSDDKGDSFKLVSNKEGLLDRPFYYCNIEADPNNADIIYSLATSFFRSTDGGENWKSLETPHGDNHDMWINPDNSDLFIECNDGGAVVTTNGGKTWSSQNNQGTAEIYQVEVDDQFPYWLYGGQQDWTTIAVPSNLPNSPTTNAIEYWMAVGGCETGPAVPKPGNPNIVYSNCKGRFGTYNKLTGQEKQYYVGASNIYGHNPKDLKYRFQRVSPIHVSPHNPDVVYHCSQYVHKTTNDGKTWETISPDLTAFEPDKQVISGSPITRDVTGEEFYSTIYAIRESKIQEGLIWVGANDGPVHVTSDGGKSWKNVTPQMPGGGRVDAVEPSPHKVGKAYACILRYQLGDWKPYIYKTTDFGESWELITKGIPEDYPVRVVREDPEKEGLLYAGTEYGMFISFNDGETWEPFQSNLPVTPVTDIQVYRNDLVLSTMGRGFWIMDNITPLHKYAEGNLKTGLLKIADSYRQQRIWGGVSGVQYNSPAVDIDYYIAADSVPELKLDIYSSDNVLVRGFSNTVKAVETEGSEPEMVTADYFKQDSIANREVKAGLRRFRWDMCHTGSWDKKPDRNGKNGPLVAPGKYSAKLTVDGVTTGKSFVIKTDPRILESGVTADDLLAQEALSIEIRDFQSEVKKAGEKIKSRIKELEEKKRQSKKDTRELESLKKNESLLYTKEGRYEQPMLIPQVQYLYSMLQRADQAPGDDACERLVELKEAFVPVKKFIAEQGY